MATMPTVQPPNIADILNQLYGQPSAPLDDAIAEISRQASKAQELSDAAQGQLRGSIVAPTPQVPPAAQSLLAGMGLASESFTGKKGAFGYGQNLIAEQNQNLLERRKQSIAELEQSYRDAAQRAEKLNDLDTSLKFKVKADRELGRLDALAKATIQGQEQGFKAQQGALDRASEEKIRLGVANIEAGARRDVARFEVQSRIETAKNLPPELQAQLNPMLEHMKQLSQAIGSVMAAPKMKEGERNKRLDQLHAELSSEGEAYQNALKSYFQAPAGNTGEAAQTPLGAIMQRARDAGVQTFEQFRKLAYSNSTSAILRGYNIKSVLAAASIDAPGAGFPKAAEVNKVTNRYRQLTTGPLRFSSIARNSDEIDTLAAKLNGWGFQVPTSSDLRAKPSYEIPETVVSAPRK
jgi:DNA repair exonuclease SbcCD ATPase subunit